MIGALRGLTQIAVILLSGVLPAPAFATVAGPITYRFEAIVTGVGHLESYVLEHVPEGGLISGSFTYDASGPRYQAAPSGIRVSIGEIRLSTTPWYARFPYNPLCCGAGEDPYYPYTRRVYGISNLMEEDRIDSIGVSAGWDSESELSSFRISGPSFDPSLQLVVGDYASISIGFENRPSTTVSSAPVLPSLLDLTAFEYAWLSIATDIYDGVDRWIDENGESYWYVMGPHGTWNIGARIVSIWVPEPAPLLLLSVVIGVGVWIRRDGRASMRLEERL